MNGSVIIDNGHGRDTAGKCSPDGRLKEWEWTRAAARILKDRLNSIGIEAVLLVPGDEDMPLRERCRLANGICAGRNDSVLVSLHSNASGDGTRWGNASGWSAFIAPGASARSQRLASMLFNEARKAGLLGNRYTPPEGFHRASFAICRDTRCPAVLTENMFHDNKADAEFLLSKEGVEAIAELHARALEVYFSSRP